MVLKEGRRDHNWIIERIKVELIPADQETSSSPPTRTHQIIKKDCFLIKIHKVRFQKHKHYKQ